MDAANSQAPTARDGTALVTGGSGFVGRHLLPLLAAEGYALRCVLRTPAALAVPDAEIIAGDLTDSTCVERALAGVHTVVHLAALVSFRRQDRAESFRVNAEATAALARLARAAGVERFLHVSTIAAVGYSDRPEVLDETAPYNFGRLGIAYCDSKHAAEQAVLAEADTGLDAVIVNPSSMFGPGDRRKAEGSLLDAAWHGRIPFCPPGGANFADVRDVAAGCVAALRRGRTGERYILGGDNLTGRQLMQTVYRCLGRKPPRWKLPGILARTLAGVAGIVEHVRPLEPPLTAQLLRLAPRYTWFSSAKAERELGYSARPVEQAIAAAVAWLVEEGVLPADAAPSAPARP